VAIRFTEVLAASCAALTSALTDFGITPTGPGSLTQIGDTDFRFDCVAAAHFAGASLHRTIIGCSTEVAIGLLGESCVGTDEDAENTAEQGLLALGEGYRQALAENLEGFRPGRRRFLVHDTRRFNVRAAGARNFHFVLPISAGTIELVIDLEPRLSRTGEYRPERDLLPDAEVDPDSDRALERPEIVQAIFAHLAKREADVRIKVQAGNSRLRFLPATVLNTRDEDEGPVESCVLTVAGVAGRLAGAGPLAGDRVDLIFALQGKLLEGSCRVTKVATGKLDDALELPLLLLELPERLEFGQRRGTDRIVPQDRLTGRLRRIDATARAVGSPLSFRVLDISDTGLRVSLLGKALLSDVKWGTPVICSLALPGKKQILHLKAVVRRLLLSPDHEERRRAILGIEFTEARENSDLSLLRRYVESECRGELEGDVALEPLETAPDENHQPTNC